MKNTYLLPLALALLVACKAKPKVNFSVPDTTHFAYHKDSTYQWEINPDTKNVTVALNALKAEEKLDTAGLEKCFDNNVEVYADGSHFKGSINEFAKVMQKQLEPLKSSEIKMNDWESVINKDKTEEWVTIRYSQYFNYKSGKRDSVEYSDDMRFNNGKIGLIREYAMHFPKAK